MTGGPGRLRARRRIDDEWLHALQKATFTYFWQQTNPTNGLIPDNTLAPTPASIAGVGLALATYAVGVARGFVTRAQARERTLATLRFFWNSTQGTDADATGHRGFYYHFLDVKTGRRAWRCELSTIDTTILLGGVLTAAAYFDRDSTPEREVRALADLQLEHLTVVYPGRQSYELGPEVTVLPIDTAVAAGIDSLMPR